MVGITLSPEQIRTAPPAVRQWLEHEIAHSLGLGPSAEPAPPDAPHLVACSPQEAAAIYASIRSMLPVVAVFFELGREGTMIGDQGLVAFRLSDMLRDTRLPDARHLATCLDVIDRAFRLARRDDHAVLSILDAGGYCIVAEATRRSVLAVWSQEMAVQQFPDGAAPEGAEISPAEPFSTSGTLPPQSIHMGQSLAEQATQPNGRRN
ncbi:MAG: hypothetical protein EOR67_23960 [Mesorhizobium sp.]|uniref:hypothetical protein n=1 Tax=Mesorhizobium sp. TaxID=1871066 RepID=UPI000FE47EBA|nr:hypothetical protein [Mesorhizobium sp.]RWL78785.1 MAG: hypothetical protein EOR69_26040 [Mesorhizobium sp.]RWL83992.1 MAG: hypothetical protein EOR67_23960 [Mesorhizobium sp.]RWL94765.1 MAG: hypothetical protein EOR70_24345 [Mesorhizobium sp.]TIP02877.1 MAG: hypothetical protein E5X72_18940 [Mesorhizobium sp.]